MDRVSAIRAQTGGEWIPEIYARRVRSQRTRALKIDVPAKANQAAIQYTLLGIELKVGKQRFACPDLATARYMRVFARLGISEFAIPYDITKISVVADELETAWQKLILIVEADGSELSASARTRLTNDIIRSIRVSVAEIGAGAAMPVFDRVTRQRRD